MNEEILDLYTDYLISSSGQTTATGLSRLLNGAVTHDVFTNFLAESDLKSQDLWKLVKKDIRQIQSEDGVIIFDDTMEEKAYTDENEIICYHWDHSQQRYIKGFNLLNCLYYSNDYSLPLGFEVIRKDEHFIDTKDGKMKRRSSVSKNELMRSMLQAVVRNEVPFSYVLTDIWFASAENMQFIEAMDKEFIMGVKSNRLVALSLDNKLSGDFVSIESLQMKDNESLTVYIKGLDFPTLLVKQVFTNKDGSEGILYLTCSDLSLSVAQVQTIYHKRWKVEEFHKSIKSNAALAKSPTRRVSTQTNHFFASIYAFVKMERLKMKHRLNHFAIKTRLYVNALKSSFEELRRLQAPDMPLMQKSFT